MLIFAKSGYLTVGELRKAISNINDDEEVFFRQNSLGNIVGANMVEHTTYGFLGLGETIPCVIIDARNCD